MVGKELFMFYQSGGNVQIGTIFRAGQMPLIPLPSDRMLGFGRHVLVRVTTAN